MTTPSFPQNRSLANPKFDSYKLSRSISHTASYPVPGSAVSQRGVQHGKTPLSVREIQSRIHHDHLALGFGGWMCWVDEGWNVWGMRIGEDLEPIFSMICSVPVPLENGDPQPSEYPSVTSLSPTTYIFSDGRGRLYPLFVTPSSTSLSGTLGPSYELLDSPSGELRPFKIEWAGGDRKVLLSSAKRTKLESGKGWSREDGFDLLLVEFEEDERDGADVDMTGSKGLNVLWELHGKDVPLYASFGSHQLLLGSSEHYFNPHAPSPSSGKLPTLPSEASSSIPQTAFSWTQTSTSITLSIPLPLDTPKSHIHVSILPKSISISLNPSSSPTMLFPLLSGFDQRAWWDSVLPDECFWQWEAKEGLLTIELEKSNQQTRWPHLFLPSSTAAVGDKGDVPETLSEDMKAAISDNLAKFTSDGSLNDELPSDLPGGLSSLLRDDMDLVDDENEGGSHGGEDGEGGGVGRKVKWSVVSAKDGKDVLSVQKEDVAAQRLLGVESLVGTQLEWVKNGFGNPGGKGKDILVKLSFDALLFQPPSVSSASFTHTKTFPALSFVLSSKRDIKYTLHTSTSSTSKVLAFTSPTTESAQGDLFVYHEANGNSTAPSGVFKMGGGEDGALVGVKAVKVGEQEVLVGLCEKKVVVLSGVL